MSQRMQTVAWFDLAYKADILCAALEEAGIPAVVTDREIVAMDWLLVNAVKGVKVQVPERDARRAEVLLRALDAKEFDLRPVSDDELERQALALAPEDGEAPPPESANPDATVPPAEPSDPTAVDRDTYARRFMLASVFSLLFPPLFFYAVYLGLVAVFGSGSITSVGWQRIGFGVAFGGVMFAVLTWLVTLMR